MSESDSSNDFEWELCKENIIPTRKGRDVKETNKVLKSMLSGDHSRLMLRERTKWEMKLKLASDDPLQVHYDYIQWIDMHYPHGGKESGMQDALETCVRKFLHSPEYKNDARYVEIWLQFIKEVTRENVVFFKYLFLSAIGTMVARFYYEWALHLEVLKKYQMAAEVYEHGILARAKPEGWLDKMFALFKQRHPDASQHILGINAVLDASGSQVEEDLSVADSSVEEEENRRQALSSLRLTGAENVGVPVLRNAPNVARPPGTYKQKPSNAPKQKENIKPPSNIMKPEVTVFRDGGRGTKQSSLKGLFSHVGVVSSESISRVIDGMVQVNVQHKENIDRPTKWSDLKTLPQKCPIADTSQKKFQIFCDSEESSSISAQSKMCDNPPQRLDKIIKPPVTGLRMRIASPSDTDYIASQQACTSRILKMIRNPTDLGTETMPSLPEPIPEGCRFMTNLCAIYGGSNEVSLEMVRASVWAHRCGLDLPF